MMADVARKIEDPELAALVRIEEGYRGPRLVESEAGFGALAKAIRAGRLDSYLNDWAPRADQARYAPFLPLAVETGEPDIVAALLERGADPNLAIALGAPPEEDERHYDVPLGCAGHSEEITRLLLNSGADVHKLSRRRSVLLLAAGKSPGAVRLLLEAGADPLLRTGVDTPLSFAARNPNYTGAETLALLQAVARKQLEGKRIASLTCKPGKKPKDTGAARGIRAFADLWLEIERSWAVLLVKASRAATSAALNKHYAGSELRTTPTEPIFDEHQPVFVVELRDMPWIIVFEEMGVRITDERLRESALALSKELGCETVGSGLWEGLRCVDGELVEEHNDDWNPEVAFDTIETSGENAREREMNRIEEQKLATMDEWFASKDIFVPRAAYDSDGCVLKLDLRGIKKKDVAGHDVVIVKTASS